ncbi:hypothetical protein QBC40DRAFT_297710 [Triangularia verruculosa]|uniref:Concanavalin A-like lectin/glucanase n=1 Tax=Triangularia verruculosa TaxID=2587418 RepID=A0AAN7ASB0_9PEZI|nr:hypothetical protein QBC40DRAFT_297710 [Triangularia verruculosa]
MYLRLLTCAIAAIMARVAFAVNSPSVLGIGRPTHGNSSNSAVSNGVGVPYYTDNWSGLSITKTPEVGISFVQGNFTIPNFPQINNDTWMRIAIQLDGSLECDTSWLTVGIAIDGSLPESERYSAFWQFNNETTHFLNSSFPLSPGDDIGLQIIPHSTTSANIEIYNAMTNMRHVSDSSSDQPTCLVSADWVMQAYHDQVASGEWDLYFNTTKWGTSDGKVWTAGLGNGPATEHLCQLMVPPSDDPNGSPEFDVWCYMTDSWGPRPGQLRCVRHAN